MLTLLFRHILFSTFCEPINVGAQDVMRIVVVVPFLVLNIQATLHGTSLNSIVTMEPLGGGVPCSSQICLLVSSTKSAKIERCYGYLVLKHTTK